MLTWVSLISLTVTVWHITQFSFVLRIALACMKPNSEAQAPTQLENDSLGVIYC